MLTSKWSHHADCKRLYKLCAIGGYTNHCTFRLGESRKAARTVAAVVATHATFPRACSGEVIRVLMCDTDHESHSS